MATSESRLFSPLKIGQISLQHRMVMAPLTRYRANSSHVHQSLAVEYYGQRASVPGTLLITEATFISPRASGYGNVPGIYNEEQIAAWSKVTEAVHAKGSYIFCQLWALGRAANPDVAKKEGIEIVSSSTVPEAEGKHTPKELNIEEIQGFVQDYAKAARNAMKAGFDGVEIHGANGYLVDQFTQDVCNKRTDTYGGSVGNRSRFAVEVTKAVVDAVGAEKVGIRFSPWSRFQGMRMQDPIPQFTSILEQLKPLGLAYIHLVESRISGNADVESSDKLEFAMKLWGKTSPILVAGGFKPASAIQIVDENDANDIAIVFGRYFISTPDLPYRIKHGLKLENYNRDTFYKAESPDGYIDYPFSKEFQAEIGVRA